MAPLLHFPVPVCFCLNLRNTNKFCRNSDCEMLPFFPLNPENSVGRKSEFLGYNSRAMLTVWEQRRQGVAGGWMMCREGCALCVHFQWCWDQLELAHTAKNRSHDHLTAVPKGLFYIDRCFRNSQIKNRGFISSRFLGRYTIVTGFRYEFQFSHQHSVFRFENRPVRAVEVIVCEFIDPVST